tara:strand:+ start:1041 stop:3239 length:2199 start_codon:yes stop_codon:yes gene_type:complete
MESDIFKKISIDQRSLPQNFISIVNNLQQQDKKQINVHKIWKAYELAQTLHEGQKRASGEPYFSHCENVGLILSKWKIDVDTIIAGLLHDTIEDTEVSKKELTQEFNSDVTNLIEGVTKLSGIRFNSKKQEQAENFMKMFLSMAKDIRVIIIKFADRLHNMSTISALPEKKQSRIALETKEIFIPLAHRLGMNNVKIKMEDLVLKTLNPDKYEYIKRKVNNTKKDRDNYIEKLINPIKKDLKINHIQSSIFGRAKHYSSIMGKIEKRNKKFEEIYDLFAIRIIVDKVSDCYASLGIIHQIYRPFQERFKDYIARPKRNGYQSIHTTVFGLQGRLVEIQIRTADMDETAEIGVAAHWQYKDSEKTINKKNNSLDRQILWLREIYELLRSEDTSASEILELFKVDLFQDEIFVYTPTGELIELKPDSTPVDFAYQVHTEVGTHCYAAKVNDKIVPLNHELKSGDYVDIITSKNKFPNQSWLKFVKTAKAKTHIRRLLKKEKYVQSVKIGKDIIEKELRKIGKMSIIKLMTNQPSKIGFSSYEEICSKIGNGKITVSELIQKYFPEEVNNEIKKITKSFTSKFMDLARGRARGVIVDGLNDIMIKFGKCCSPIPGDSIVGYLTRGQGVTIHRASCKSSITKTKDKDRFVNVDWDISSDRTFIVRLKMIFEDRKNLLKDLTEATSALNIYIKSIDMKAIESVATCFLIVEISGTNQLDRLIKRLQQVQSIDHIERF